MSFLSYHTSQLPSQKHLQIFSWSDPYGGLIENGPHSHIYLNTWPAVDGTV